MKTISIHVSEKAYREFQHAALQSGRPVAELIRQAMAEYLEREDARRSILDLPAHDSGKLLRSWSRSQILDEMIS
jgi:predicted transcriptional regulator